MAYWSPLDVATTVGNKDVGYLRLGPAAAAAVATALLRSAAMYVGWINAPPPAVRAAPCKAATVHQPSQQHVVQKVAPNFHTFIRYY